MMEDVTELNWMVVDKDRKGSKMTVEISSW